MISSSFCFAQERKIPRFRNYSSVSFFLFKYFLRLFPFVFFFQTLAFSISWSILIEIKTSAPRRKCNQRATKRNSQIALLTCSLFSLFLSFPHKRFNIFIRPCLSAFLRSLLIGYFSAIVPFPLYFFYLSVCIRLLCDRFSFFFSVCSKTLLLCDIFSSSTLEKLEIS